jgi:NADH-quinone oxidoreductase subunit I
MLGRGILRGLIETWRNFQGSYYDPARLTTVQYPEEKLPPQENARTIPFLVYDGEDPLAGLRCTACSICAVECPAHCIEIVKDTAKKPDYLGKMQFHPKVFNIEMAVCMECGVCAEVCPFDSIKMDRVFELSSDDRRMVLQKSDLAKSNDYFRKIHPAEAAAVDAARAEEQRKAQAKKDASPVPVAS